MNKQQAYWLFIKHIQNHLLKINSDIDFLVYSAKLGLAPKLHISVILLKLLNHIGGANLIAPTFNNLTRTYYLFLKSFK